MRCAAIEVYQLFQYTFCVEIDKSAIDSPHEIEAAGIPSDRSHVTERDGGPGYLAIVESLHQLHCLVS
jgi:hypothetical protein